MARKQVSVWFVQQDSSGVVTMRVGEGRQMLSCRAGAFDLVAHGRWGAGLSGLAPMPGSNPALALSHASDGGGHEGVMIGGQHTGWASLCRQTLAAF